ncbi:hypothetical protein TPCV2_06230 [Cutibacterium avidum]|nr:restriction endonuclease subunit S [Cutibacterium avidum]
MQYASLGELGVMVLDCEHRTPSPAPAGHPYVAIPDIQQGRVVLETTRRITDEDLLDWTRRTKPRAGDILVTRRGRVGDTAPIPTDDCAIGQNLVILRSDGTVIDQSFLRWATRGPAWQSEVDRLINVGAVFSSLNVGDIGKMRIPVLPLPEQQAIAEVLGALDDKIAANRALVATADDLATAIYRRESSTTAPLSSLAKFVNGRNFTKDASGTGRAVIRIAELNSGIGDSTVFNDVGALPQNVAGPGDILFAWSGSLTLKRWTAEEGLVNQHIFKVIPNSDVPQWLVYQAIRHALPDFKAIAADKATTMGHIQRHHLDAKVPIPTTSQTVPLDPLMGGLWQMALAAEVESATLAALRDTLLPALMNGTLRVKDAERTVSEAL